MLTVPDPCHQAGLRCLRRHTQAADLLPPHHACGVAVARRHSVLIVATATQTTVRTHPATASPNDCRRVSPLPNAAEHRYLDNSRFGPPEALPRMRHLERSTPPSDSAPPTPTIDPTQAHGPPFIFMRGNQHPFSLSPTAQRSPRREPSTRASHACPPNDGPPLADRLVQHTALFPTTSFESA